jgi:hypothetical protein
LHWYNVEEWERQSAYPCKDCGRPLHYPYRGTRSQRGGPNCHRPPYKPRLHKQASCQYEKCRQTFTQVRTDQNFCSGKCRTYAFRAKSARWELRSKSEAERSAEEVVD